MIADLVWTLPPGLLGGIFLPVNYGSADEFPAPAPVGPLSASLDGLVGGQPNGTWSLYVFDDTQQDGGSVAGGWSLDLVSSTEEVAAAPASLAAGIGSFSVSVTMSDPAPDPEPDTFLIKRMAAWRSAHPTRSRNRSTNRRGVAAIDRPSRHAVHH